MVKTMSPSWSAAYANKQKRKTVPFLDYNRPSNDQHIRVPASRVPHHVSNINTNTHPRRTVQVHCTPHRQLSMNPMNTKTYNASNTSINPFNNPPPNAVESDVRWIWRKTLQSTRSDTRNTVYYNNYIGNKKTAYTIHTPDPTSPLIESNKYSSGFIHCSTKKNHLKHLVKVGCPKHDLSPVLKQCGYIVHPEICTHKSYVCASQTVPNILLNSFSLKAVGLTFKRNAFSNTPLHIEYIPDETSNTQCFATDIYIQRLTNTNFNKAFRPGVYGTLQSIKKGSWKEGKIFFVFDDDDIVLRINEDISIVFDIKSSVSNEIIDGFKDIVGGVGFYRSAKSTDIASCLVLRNDPDFPMECIKHSTIKILSNGTYSDNSKLIIGDKMVDLNMNNNVYNANNESAFNVTSSTMTPSTSLDTSESSPMNPSVPTPCIYDNEDINTMNVCMEKPPNTVYHNDTVSAPCFDALSETNDVRSYYPQHSLNDNVTYYPKQHSLNNNVNTEYYAHEFEMQDKYCDLQYKYSALLQKAKTLQSLNMQLMASNTELQREKDYIHAQYREIQALQTHVKQQNQQIYTLRRSQSMNNECLNGIYPMRDDDMETMPMVNDVINDDAHFTHHIQ